MMADLQEDPNQTGDEDQGEPGAQGKFAYSDNQGHDASCQGAYAIDQAFCEPSSLAQLMPVNDHTRLG